MAVFETEIHEGFNTVVPPDGWLWGPGYRRREERGGLTFLACIHCGRNTGQQDKSFGVLVSGGGYLLVQPDDYDDFPHEGGDMGWWPVGTECIKAVPVAFRSVSPYEDRVLGI